MHTTNYVDTFITVAPDSTAIQGLPPPERTPPSIAQLTFRMIHDHPYRYTSDDVIFGVFAQRNAIGARELAAARAAFFAKGQPCLRCSDLAKKYGWGIHSDGDGRVALVAVETRAYAALASGKAPRGRGKITVTSAMRAKR